MHVGFVNRTFHWNQQDETLGKGDPIKNLSLYLTNSLLSGKYVLLPAIYAPFSTCPSLLSAASVWPKVAL